MGKAKTASKNNPTSRVGAKEFFYNEKKIKPVKLVGIKSTFFGAEYVDNNALVLDDKGSPIPWERAKS